MSARVNGRFVGAMGLTSWVLLVALLGSAGVANASLGMIGCDGMDDDEPGITGLGGDNCDDWATALNGLDGVSGVDCGGNYPYLYGDDCDAWATALNKLVGGSHIHCDEAWSSLMVRDGDCPDGSPAPNGTLAALAAILQGPTCKHGTPAAGPAGGGNCIGACDHGWSGSNCDLPGVSCTVATASQCAAESCPASAPYRPNKCVEGAANGTCQTFWLKNSSCSSCIDLSKCPSCNTHTHKCPQPPPTPVAHCQPELAKSACYQDSEDVRVLPHTVDTDSLNLTQELCAGYCAALNYSFAGVESGLLCFCGDRLPDASYMLPAVQCGSRKCSGNPAEDCGAANIVLVYPFVCDVCGKYGTGARNGKLLRSLATPTACACKAACGSVHGCKAWQWIYDLKAKNSKQCYLRDTAGMVPNAYSTAGTP